MNTSLSWIRAYVPDLDVSAKEYSDAMTLSGTKVETYEEKDADLDKIVVGEIKEIVKHPDADHLIICQVNIGAETIQIVTGASNVAVGNKVPVVLPGGRVAGGHDGSKTPGGIVIKNGKLRGVPSAGMMCSIEELGSTREMYPEAPENGIYIFPDDVKVGEDAIGLLGLHDAVIEYEVTSNRVDCYSVIGIAREAAATFNKKFVLPPVGNPGKAENGKAEDEIKVCIDDPDLCTRYCARVVKNIRLAPSPDWMRKRLAVHGIRPINNIVDITNYVMEEYGQPMHAYDLDTVAGRQIIVSRAKDGEKFVTLDGQEHTMDSSVLMIRDAEKAIGMAGIMGGENSMITDDVKTLLFEAATFNGPNIRKSAKMVGLRTDASGKFEKGLEPERALAAINRACELIEELDAGDVTEGVVDIYPVKREPVAFAFDADAVNFLLGTDLSAEEQKEYLARVELCPDENGIIHVPSFRQDIHATCDIAEEVARFYGYDKIPTCLPTGEATAGKVPFKNRVESMARSVAEYCGFSQGMCYSFESPKVFDKLLLPEDSSYRNAIEIRNPLGEDFSIMRTMSLNGILSSLAFNKSHRNKDVRLYELGNVYLPKALPLTELPEERMKLTLGMYGQGDFFDLKGACEEIFDKVGIHEKLTYDPTDKKPFLHPGRQADIISKGKTLGYLGEVHPLVCKNYDIKERVYVAVLDMQNVTEQASFERKFCGIARFPAVSRDISLVMKKTQMVSEIENVIEKKGGQYLESYRLFDLYEGDQIDADSKSVAYSITFRAKDKTLTDADVSEAMDRILKTLSGIGIELRK